MGIAGLSTYSSQSFYYAMGNRNKSNNVGNESAFRLLSETDIEQNNVATTSNKTGVATAGVAYSRCITASIRSEELLATQSADGEMIYSYKASEQSFKIWINSDGSNKTYSIEGMDKDGQPFTKEFDPYDVDPECADFPEFAALCMYIQNTDETADMLANEYFATDDILEKCDYLDKMQGFSMEGIFEKTEAMMDNIDKLMATLHRITGMRNDINSFFEPFFTKYLVEDVDLSDYPEVTMSAADLIKMLEENHKLTSQGLKEDKDWREMSDDEWDKMMEGIDKYIDAFKERLRHMKEMQEKAAQKAALEADAGNESIAASSAALAAANGFVGVTSTETDTSEGAMPTEEGDYEKNWTKMLNTDNQTILMEAKEAQKMEKMVERKIEDIANDTEDSSYEYISVVDRIEQKEKNAEGEKEPLRLIAMDRNGIRLINDETHEYEWEIKFNSEEEYRRAAKMMNWAGKNPDIHLGAANKSQWLEFLSGKMSEGNFKNILKSQGV